MCQLNRVFYILKQGEKQKWKIIQDPRYRNKYCLIYSHPYMCDGVNSIDLDYIWQEANSIEEAYEMALQDKRGH